MDICVMHMSMMRMHFWKASGPLFFLNSPGRFEHFLNLTGRHIYFLRLTCDIKIPCLGPHMMIVQEGGGGGPEGGGGVMWHRGPNSYAYA